MRNADPETGMTPAAAARVLRDPEETDREVLLSAKVTLGRAYVAEQEERQDPEGYAEREALRAKAAAAREAERAAEARFWAAVDDPETSEAEIEEARAAFDEAMYAADSAQAELAFA